MASIAQHDSRFDEAEAEIDHGTSWLFREPDAPNPLTIKATGWSTGMTKLGEAEFLNGVDRDGKKWSVLVGSVVLTKKLIEGLVEKWDDDKKVFVVVETLGRVQPDEVVSIIYLGEVDGARYPYPNFKIVRKPLDANTPEPESTPTGAVAEKDIPF
jgi:hypothetical protein